MNTMEDTRDNRVDLAILLDNVIETLKSEGSWLRGSLAMTRTGRVVHPTNPNARKFCVTGAVSHNAQDVFKERVGLVAIWATIARLLGAQQLTVWNDAGKLDHETMLAELTRVRDKLRHDTPIQGGTL